MADPFDRWAPSLEGPAVDMYAPTPDDDTDLATVGRAIIVAVSGTLRVTTHAGEVRNLPAALLPVGMQIDIRVKRVHSTGTTATIWILV